MGDFSQILGEELATSNEIFSDIFYEIIKF